jgi:hypothetical protein
MNKNLLFLIFWLITGIHSYSQSSYLIKSCKIQLTYDAHFIKGTKTIVFADSGKIEKVIGEQFTDVQSLKDSVFNGWVATQEMKSLIHILQIHKGDTLYSIDLDNKIGSRQITGALLRSFDPSYEFKNILGDEKVGEDTFLGRKCDIWKMGGMHLWYWKGIVLKKEFTDPGMQQVAEYATSIDENYAIKKDEFDIPKGIVMK